MCGYVWVYTLILCNEGGVVIICVWVVICVCLVVSCSGGVCNLSWNLLACDRWVSNVCNGEFSAPN